jgi:hypothetical protein
MTEHGGTSSGNRRDSRQPPAVESAHTDAQEEIVSAGKVESWRAILDWYDATARESPIG